jgi:hypothetical protein
MVSVFVVRTAMLRRLRLLIACLLLAVTARPAVDAFELSRPVAVFVASAGARLAREVSPPAVLRAEAVASTPRVGSLTERVPPAALAAPPLTASARTPFRGASPLYLTHERLLL